MKAIGIVVLTCAAFGAADAEVARLAKQLQDEKTEKRLEAANELANLGPDAKEAIPALTAALKGDKEAKVPRLRRFRPEKDGFGGEGGGPGPDRRIERQRRGGKERGGRRAGPARRGRQIGRAGAGRRAEGLRVRPARRPGARPDRAGPQGRAAGVDGRFAGHGRPALRGPDARQARQAGPAGVDQGAKGRGRRPAGQRRAGAAAGRAGGRAGHRGRPEK